MLFAVCETCAALKVQLWDPVRWGKRSTSPVLARGMSGEMEAVGKGGQACSLQRSLGAGWRARGKRSSVGLTLSVSVHLFCSVSSGLTACVIKVSISNEQDFMNRGDLPTPPH